MARQKNERTPETRSRSATEVQLKGRAVSRGIALGTIVWLHGDRRQFYRISLKTNELAREVKRLQNAVATAKRQLARLATDKGSSKADSATAIFEAHRVLLEDSSLENKFEQEIVAQKVNAEWAIKHVTDVYVSQYKAIENEHFRERYIDIEDVAERILAALDSHPAKRLPFAKDTVIAARELRPSTLVELAGSPPLAIVAENGGWTSHTYILARELKLPAVTGIKKLLRRVKNGDSVVVDGFNGRIIVNPANDTLKLFAPAKPKIETKAPATDDPDSIVKTLDGKAVRILANADSESAYRKAQAFGAAGIGLFRSEFLFDSNRGVPSEAKQFDAYKKIADAAGEDRVKIRTFDLGADRLVEQAGGRETNPALGLRAIRLGLAYEKLLRTQLRALLRASHKRNIDIVIPMVSGVSEVRKVKRMLKEEADTLRSKGKPSGKPGVGVMIEVPAAVMQVDELLVESDFVCLGTNDLIQYLLAVDRDNETVAGWYQTLHPAVLKAIRRVLNASSAAEKPAIVCGEMAGSPFYAPILIGLGAEILSMNVNSIERVRRVVSGIAAEEARQLVRSLETLSTVEEIDKKVRSQARKNWLHLFPEDFAF
ncbi:MAG TPA: phosphoenolpyruvate--protein phosphotransferase [Pyrinomonadaceae bacterium]|nr:phosphoenolpyruvate--protein phosphotransferase [Pyrinomonadaceae bacterium]